VVNADSNTVSYFRILDGGTLRLVDAAPSGGTGPVSVTAHAGWVRGPHQGNNTVGSLLLTSRSLVPSSHAAVSLSSAAATPEQIGFTPSGAHLIVTEKVSSSIDTFTVTSGGQLTGLRHTASTGTAPYGFGFSSGGDAIVSDAGGGAGGVSAATSYRVGAAGALHPISEVGESQAAACWLTVNATGTRAYLANAGSGTVSSYNIGPGGRLHLRSDVAATVGVHPIDEVLGAAGSSSSPPPLSRRHRSLPRATLAPSTSQRRAAFPQRRAASPSSRSPRRAEAGGCNKPSFTKAGRHRAVRLLADFSQNGSGDHHDAELEPRSDTGGRGPDQTCPGFLRRPDPRGRR